MKVSELEGLKLDYWTGMAVQIWKDAHKLYPTWTLDPTFSGLEIRGEWCLLIPNNPFRQDPQEWNPSQHWSQGGPLLDRYNVDLRTTFDGVVASIVSDQGVFAEEGPTRLIAACRAIVMSVYGEEVPDEKTI